jgi:hypothetical protein
MVLFKYRYGGDNMTIKELKATLEQKLTDEKKMASEATCKYSEGLHEGHALGLQEALYFLTYLEGYNEERND